MVHRESSRNRSDHVPAFHTAARIKAGLGNGDQFYVMYRQQVNECTGHRLPCLHPIGRATPATVCIPYFLTPSFIFDWNLRELVITSNLRDSHLVSYGASGKCQSVESHEIRCVIVMSEELSYLMRFRVFLFAGMVLGAIGVCTNKLLCFL
ncbi:hypothetical protein BDR04DRAFT_1104372 [Suillus decipiens]|nr:hypothetical protein BDR04DRAFT_1104372 [Suillus decipiens]